MLHTNLRELLQHQEFTNPLEEEEGTLRPPTNVVQLGKDREAVVFLIGDEGESIEMYKAGTQVSVPLPFYGGDSEGYVENAIKERIAATLDSTSTLGGTEPPLTVPLDDALVRLAERLKPRPLRAVLCNEVTARLLEPIAQGVKVYSFDAFHEGHVIGLSDPKYVGLLITDSRPHADDPEPDPAFEEHASCRAGIITMQRGVTAVMAQP